MYSEITIRDFDIRNLFDYDEVNDLSEALIDNVQLVTSFMATPENLGKIITKETPLLKIGLLIFKLFRNNKNLSTLQRINRAIFAIGPISILIIYMFLGEGVVRNIAEIFIKHIVANLVMNKFLRILTRFIFKIAQKGRQSVMAVFVSIFMLPIAAFFTMIGSLLLKGDPEAQRIVQRQDIYWIKVAFRLFKLIATALLETIPFLKPFIQFISLVFQKIGVMFKTGGSAAKKVIQQAQQESSTLQEGFLSTAAIFGAISIFFMKILKTTKIIGIIGLIFVMLFKIAPGLKQIVMKLPLIGPIVTTAQTLGRSLASRFKLNNAAQALDNAQKEAKELQTTVQVMSAIAH